MHKKHMNCEEVLRHLMAWVDRETDAAATAAIERHLEECRGCFSRAEFEKQLKKHVRHAASTRAPERLRSRIRELIRKF